MDKIIYIYQYAIFFYTLSITVVYVSLMLLGYLNIRHTKQRFSKKEERLFDLYPEIAPGISIVAPAYNEEVIIVESVATLLNLDYPKFEVIVVNDGSKDKTLDLLIDEFNLSEIPFNYTYKVHCQTVKRIFKSTNTKYHNLTVLDKHNGGTKADAMNAGVNYIKYDYFINTDVDCLLAPYTLKKVILPVLDSKELVIAVGATMRMVNGCKVENGTITRVRPPSEFIPTFQETEYLRSYLVAKMGWSVLNSIPNVSGGFGLFNTEVVVNTGGFDPLSHAEDMDMTIRMRAHMYDKGEKHRIVQIPDTCAWTEGPPNINILKRQRTRWGRGLMQIFFVHYRFLFNRKYGKMGWLVLPYALFFELMAPILETGGIIFLIYLLIAGQINFATFWLMLLFAYLIGISVSLITILLDMKTKQHYQTFREYLRLVLFSSFESLLYHPLIVIFSLVGYWQFFTRKNFRWGTMTRRGFSKR